MSSDFPYEETLSTSDADTMLYSTRGVARVTGEGVAVTTLSRWLLPSAMLPSKFLGMGSVGVGVGESRYFSRSGCCEAAAASISSRVSGVGVTVAVGEGIGDGVGATVGVGVAFASARA